MPLHSPLPKSLSSECSKCASILDEFTMPGASMGPDKLIPPGILAACKGIAVISVFKVGFLVTIRGGSGLVVARLGSGSWSAPSCIGLGGLGGGFEVGAECTDFVILLNSQKAVDSFKKGGNVTLGGNLSVAAGPIGRNVEADVALRNAAAFYTYSKTRGLFVGISLEGSVIVERKGANNKIYGSDVRARDLLVGRYEQPEAAKPLYHSLDRAVKTGIRDSVSMAMGAAGGSSSKGFSGSFGSSNSGGGGDSGGGSSGGNSRRMSMPKMSRPSIRRPGRRSPSSSSGGGRRSASPTEANPPQRFDSTGFARTAPIGVPTQKWNTQRPSQTRRQQAKPQQTKYSRKLGQVKGVPLKEAKIASEEWDQDAFATALFGFKGPMDCDLAFKKGDRIRILTRTGSQDDWWEGELDGKVGIFPANYTSA